MFRFAHTEYLYLLILLPVLALMFAVIFSQRKKALKRFGNLDVISPLMPAISYSRPILKSILVLLALTSLVFGIARPQFGSKLREIKREGVEIVIALDVSNSMMAEDIQPNRLERAKQAIARLVDRLVNDKIGLIVFAGDAYTQIPVTTDYVSAKLFLNTISTEIVPKQGTAIGSAIELAMRSFTQQEETGKALIIITDGENHEDDAVEAAGQALEKGITVHTIGIGLPQGAPIPVMSGGQKTYRKDNKGQTVISKLDETMLRGIAAAGEGVYIRSTDTRVGLDKLFDEINKMEKQEMEAKIYSDYDERFQYVFGLSLFFLLLDFMVLDRKNRWLSKIKLFERTW
jgi:Ca-activated chloride channel family protein